MSTYRPGDKTPLRGLDHLRESLTPAAPEAGRIGIEWELLPIGPAGEMVPYAGPGGVESAFSRLAKAGYAASVERRRVVGLEAPDGAFLGLEPGGQVEVSTPPRGALADLQRTLSCHAAALAEAASRDGWRPAAWGLAPRNSPEDMADVPKERYALLADYLRERGTQGRWMMKLTASSQLCLDVPAPSLLREQVDGALRLLPYLAGWLANSPVKAGRLGRWKTHRPAIWRHTDRLRCGLPAFLFNGVDLEGGWLRWALSRPALFFVRGRRWIAGGGRTFADWWRDPKGIGRLTVEDWQLHLSTLFPELRYRGYLEIRTPDSVPLPLLMAAAALCKGLLGDPGRVREWRGLLPDPDPSRSREDLLRAGRGGGKWVPLSGPSPAEVAPRLFRAARRGLRALREDPGWLDPLALLARDGGCPADTWQRSGEGFWRGPEALVDWRPPRIPGGRHG